jgi:hypothetical protein
MKSSTFDFPKNETYSKSMLSSRHKDMESKRQKSFIFFARRKKNLLA